MALISAYVGGVSVVLEFDRSIVACLGGWSANLFLAVVSRAGGLHHQRLLLIRLLTDVGVKLLGHSVSLCGSTRLVCT